MLVYISGKITGNENYKQEFAQAERLLKKMGYEVCNPVTLGKQLESWKYNPTYLDYMRADIKHLLNCEGIYYLPSWKRSKGAKLERIIAEFFKMVEVEIFEVENERKSRID